MSEFADWPETWQQGSPQIDNLEAWAWQETENQRKLKPTIPQLQAHFDERDATCQKLVDERNRLLEEWQQSERDLRGDDAVKFMEAHRTQARITARAKPLESDIQRAADERSQASNALIQARNELAEIRAARRSLRPVNGHASHNLSRLQAMTEDMRLAKEQQRLEGR